MEENQTISLNHFKLIPASIEDHPIIQNMGRFYVYDMSQFFAHDADWKMPEDGLYECIDFKKYWQTDDTWPFILRYRGELAGFVIIDKKGSDPQVDYNMAQYFILRRFKGLGVGKMIAQRCFDQYQGIWEVMVMPDNKGAYQFWQKTIQQYTGEYEEYERQVKHFDNSLKKIFRFDSKPYS